MTDLEDAVQAGVEEATDSGTFDVLDFVSGASLPEDIITIHTDLKSAYRLKEIYAAEKARDEKSKSEGIGMTDEVGYTDEDEVEELTEKLKASAVTFYLRGLAPKAQEAIQKSLQATLPYKQGSVNEEYDEAFAATLMAKTIQKSVNVRGQIDSKKWDAERVREFSLRIAPSEFDKLYLGVFKVNYLGDAIDRAVNADFS